MPAGFFEPCNMSNRFACFALFFSGLVLLASCGALPELQKRKYRDGFYVHKSGKKAPKETQKQTAIIVVPVKKEIAPTFAGKAAESFTVEKDPALPVPGDPVAADIPAAEMPSVAVQERNEVTDPAAVNSSIPKHKLHGRPMDYVVDPGPLLIGSVLLFLAAAGLVWMCFLGTGFLIAAIVLGLVVAFLSLGLTLVNTNNCYSRGWIITTEIFLVAAMLLLLPCTLFCLFFIFVIWNRIS
jgi:hypothetical protein